GCELRPQAVMALAELAPGYVCLYFARQGCVRAARAQPHGAKRTCAQPAASAASRTPAWRRSRHPNTKIVHSLAPRSGREPSLRQAQRAASPPGGAAAIQAQKTSKKITKVHPPLADNQHVPV
ncbi:hypothetical protein, partial [Idiomarina sp.]|uniref:hypothetical protein n=1 Tax=Idiomarina sp. TaxID=1874361 RepID=UPI002584DA0D